MHPQFIASLHIRYYSFFLLAGFFAGYLLLRWRLKQDGIEGRHADNLALILILVCLFGAKFFNRLFYQPSVTSVWEALKFWKTGGLVFYGGLIFGIISVLLYSAIMRVALTQLADAFAPSLALGLAFGRVGCYMAGCCWGDVCAGPEQLACITNAKIRYELHTFPALSGPDFPLAVSFPRNSYPYKQHLALGLISTRAPRSLPVHPVQLYEAVFCLLLCLLLSKAFPRRKHPGDIFCLFVMAYAAFRFGLEFLRSANPLNYWGMSISQIISLILLSACMALFIARRVLSCWNANRIESGSANSLPEKSSTTKH
jgi:phosphatidylglycerol:prolipoprotein diacylglycerol transferase